MKKALLLTTIVLTVLLNACNHHQKTSRPTPTEPPTSASAVTQETTPPTSAPTQLQTLPEETVAPPETEAPRQEQPQEEQSQVEEQPQEEHTLQMTIGNTPVSVAWEDNDAVDALTELCRSGTLTIVMSMYGGFEQVGSIGASLPTNDVQTTTTPGDIVLYSGDQMVVFYGSNSWAYTRLGHITDKTPQELTQLLSNGDTEITLELI